jgi:hypothetical protein
MESFLILKRERVFVKLNVFSTIIVHHCHSLWHHYRRSLPFLLAMAPLLLATIELRREKCLGMLGLIIILAKNGWAIQFSMSGAQCINQIFFHKNPK